MYPRPYKWDLIEVNCYEEEGHGKDDIKGIILNEEKEKDDNKERKEVVKKNAMKEMNSEQKEILFALL